VNSNRTGDRKALRPAPPAPGLNVANRLPIGPLLALVVTVVATAAIRLRLLALPLERDEGEYAYAGQRILEGHPPYERLYNMKWPGTYYCYALFEAIFGQTIEGVHLGVLIVNVVAIVLVFLICRRVLDATAAAAAAVAYALLSLSPWTLGFAGHATHFVVVFALAAILCLQQAFERRRLGLYFVAGVFAGLASLMKQPGLVFTAFVAAYWAWHEMTSASVDLSRLPASDRIFVTGWGGWWRYMLAPFWSSASEWRQMVGRGAILIAGILVPFIVLFVSLVVTHTWDAFWLWTIAYARYYGEPFNAKVVKNFWDGFKLVVGDGVLFWIGAGFGLLAVPLTSRTRSASPFLVWLLIFSVVGLLPGFTFREHYFILVLPVVACLFGAAVSVARERVSRRFPKLATAAAVALVLIPLSTAFAMEGPFYLWRTPEEACRNVYQENPFIEAVGVADFIRARTNPDDAIAVIGSEPELYFYSRRPSATGFIYMYPLIEKQPYARQFQRQMIEEVEAARPKYVVFVNLKASWLPPPEADMTVANWFIDYQSRQLTLVGLVEVDAANHVTYRGAPDDLTPHPNVRTVMTVYERRARD
jgi:4-amino-4-deoxy-L-arabinose transferase-like glycosyltransferase